MDAPLPNSVPTPLADLQRLTDARGEVMRAEFNRFPLAESGSGL
ncbi:hypothetical protein R5W23_004177 [Gemmata sp. JC673]|uniref:Uncharacterized protein n=1 Tax=Gemmata algarum TaxID=2975278 RepID=A0ABU5F692_9BACT|nr:hypothetical protein [Gemmata algarum]MDY3562699.1 hypothetical protein [Gemmata algarum]